jgi:phosphoglycerol transferase MdoB-like AlkP superfamily enzyme
MAASAGAERVRGSTRWLRWLAACVLANAAVFSLLRLVLWLWFGGEQAAEPAGALGWAFYLGAKFDLRLALLIGLPCLALAWIPWLDPLATRAGRWLWVVYFAAAHGLAVFAHAVDFGHFAYLRARLDASAVRLLEDPEEAFGVLWESYPIVSGSLGLLLYAALFGALLWALAARLAARPPVPRSRGRALALALGWVALYAFGIYGKLSWYPLRWSDAFFSTHDFVSQLALNPVLYLYDTWKNRVLEYDAEQARRHYPTMAEYLDVDAPDPERLDYLRARGAQPPAERPNVVIVLLESFAFYKTGASGNPLDPTPHFDALARDGILFRRFYTPHWGTARGVFTTLTSLPDVEPQRTSSRNPLIVKQHTLLNAFEGYEKFYFIGGSASWGNIRGLLAHNVPDLQLYEEGSYASPRIDVWGISDLHLLEEAGQVLSKVQGRPFVAVIQTAGNHEPYTLPDDRRGFATRDLDDDAVRPWGFKSSEDFESFRFLDHSLGVFFEQARRADWFDDTIFALTGDHGLPRRADHRPPGEKELRLDSFHVPLVLYAPGRIEGGLVVDTPAGLADLLPTLARLASLPYATAALGRDLFDRRYDAERFAFVMFHGGLPRIGLVGAELYYSARADGSESRLQEIYGEDPSRDVAAERPEAARELRELAFAIYETARYMRYHNAPEQIAAPRQGSLPPLGAAR